MIKQLWDWCCNWSQERFRAVDGWIKVLTAVISLAGIVIGLIQLNTYLNLQREENHKREREVQTRHQELITRLYQMDYELQGRVMANPFIYTCMYMDPDGKQFNALKPDDKSKVLATCAMYADVIELYLLLEDGLSGNAEDVADIKAAWRDYGPFLWERSAAFRDHMTRVGSIFTKKTRKNVGSLK